MLVLGRKLYEETVVVLPDGTEIIAQVVRIAPDKVRIGWMAPAAVKIHRREVYEAIQRSTK